MKKKIIRINKQVLPEKEPVAINISGNIDSVVNWLEKRAGRPEQTMGKQLGELLKKKQLLENSESNDTDQKEAGKQNDGLRDIAAEGIGLCV